MHNQEFIPANEAIVYPLSFDVHNLAEEISDMYLMRISPLILFCPLTPPLSPVDYQANIIAHLTTPGVSIYLYREPEPSRELTTYLVFQQDTLTMRLVCALHSAKINYSVVVLELIPICKQIAHNAGCYIFNFHLHRSVRLPPALAFCKRLDQCRYSTSPDDIEYEVKI